MSGIIHLRFGALCKNPKNRGRSFYANGDPKKATGRGERPVAPDTKRAAARSICDKIVAIPNFLSGAHFFGAANGSLIPSVVCHYPRAGDRLSKEK